MKVKIIILVVLLFNIILNAGQQFIVIGDPHIHENRKERLHRLQTAINFLNINSDNFNISFIVIIGDIALDIYGLNGAKDVFYNSNIPCIPIIGDNEFQAGINQQYYQIFTPYYQDELSSKLSGLEIQSNGDKKCNLSFNIGGIKYVFLDCCTNAEHGKLDSESEKWLNQKTNEASKMRYGSDLDYVNNMIVFSHHPLSLDNSEYGFSSSDVDKIENIDNKYFSTINSNFCGHAHITFYWKEGEYFIFNPLFDTYFTEALFNLKESTSTLESADELAEIINKIIKVIGLCNVSISTSNKGISLYGTGMVPITIDCPELTGMDLLNYADGKLFTSEFITMALVEVSENIKKLAAGKYYVDGGYLHTINDKRTVVGSSRSTNKIWSFPSGLQYKEIIINVKHIQIEPDAPTIISYD